MALQKNLLVRSPQRAAAPSALWRANGDLGEASPLQTPLFARYSDYSFRVREATIAARLAGKSTA